uniref:F-ATPase delta subunit n=1 Tax=Aceria tosichella TaxID=561515 RepID=A0A6G1SCE0_9ACAR
MSMLMRSTRALLRSMVSRRLMATEAAAPPQKKEGLSLTFASPAQSFYKDTKVRQVDVPSYSGSLGILANHVPILAVMKPGVVNVIEDDGTSKRYFVAAGTVTMNEDSSLLLLASEAVAVEDLDLAEAQKNLNAAASQSTPEAKIAAEVNQAIVDSARS